MKKINFNPTKITIVVIALLFFDGCEISDYEKTDVLLSDETELTLKSADLRSEIIKDYAKILSLSLTEEVKSTIKKEALKKFDGDYDILTSNFEEQQLGSVSIKEVLGETRKNRTIKSKFFKHLTDANYFSKIKEEIPNLQISVPIHCDEWDPTIFTPPVAFLPLDYNEKECKEINAYDEFGNLIKLDPLTEPDFPVIVVCVSERVDRSGNLISSEPIFNLHRELSLKSAPTFPTGLTIQNGNASSFILNWNDVATETKYQIWRMGPKEYFFYLRDSTGQNVNYYVNSGLTAGKKYWYLVRAKNNDGTSPSSNIVASHASSRNDGDWLKIKKMKFTSSYLNYVEHWIAGAPEIRLRVVRGFQGGASTVFTSGILEPNKRKDIKDTWWECQVPIANWYTSSIGSVLNFDWREEDQPSPKVSFTITSSYEDKDDNATIKSGNSITITDDPGDSDIGSCLVHYWDSESQIYDLSGFSFQLVY